MTLPVEAAIPELMQLLQGGRNAALAAPPGAGKTTRVPLALLDEPWLQGQRLLLLEPRRIAARMAAARMAEQLGEPVGGTVGYRVRMESRVSARTRIEVVTEGVLVRLLQQDPELSGYRLLIFDEFHERSLQADLGLALALDIQSGLRDDLRILAMSATLDTAAVADLLGGKAVSCEGQRHPVTIRYLSRDPESRVEQAVAGAVRRALDKQQGDLLCFLPGTGEIRRTAALLEDLGDSMLVLPLYGDLPLAEQRRVLEPVPGRRRIVLATSVAETSLTIEGITTVVDAGWSRIPRFDPRSGLTRLETARVSLAEAEQRAGRAGRLGPGVAYRLWSEGTQARLLPRRDPEILAADLAPLVLDLAQWGVRDPAALNWLDPPPPGAFAQARELLVTLGALDTGGRLTADGRRMAALPVHPRLARLLLAGVRSGAGSLAADIAALLSERDPLKGGDARDCRFDERLRLLGRYRRDGASAVRAGDGDVAACRTVDRAARRLRELVAGAAGHTGDAGLLLAQAYPDRVAVRRSGTHGRFLLANGRGARVDEACPLAGELMLVAPTVSGEGAEARIRLAESLEPSAFREAFAGRLEQVEALEWNEAEERVTGTEQLRFGRLVLESRALPRPDPAAVTDLLVCWLERAGADALPWNDESRRLRQRVALLRRLYPEEQWPDWSDGALNSLDWLKPWLAGMSRRSDLRRLDLASVLRNELGHARMQLLEQRAPEFIAVPSGHRRRVDYTEDKPVLAVKLQEMFGAAETPRIGEGRLALVLHLLSPAGRPVQVTEDLRGFWERTYPEVRKELRGRYAKHPWPEDPWNAPATAGTRRR